MTVDYIMILLKAPDMQCTVRSDYTTREGDSQSTVVSSMSQMCIQTDDKVFSRLTKLQFGWRHIEIRFSVLQFQTVMLWFVNLTSSRPIILSCWPTILYLQVHIQYLHTLHSEFFSTSTKTHDSKITFEKPMSINSCNQINKYHEHYNNGTKPCD